mmetsp:Transcript_35301/g.75213  ORF Transcript_35301/g.75213 Transcript_35301/m.75213 type:complete len:215 (-) Transcript_35301:8-652(-)
MIALRAQRQLWAASSCPQVAGATVAAPSPCPSYEEGAGWGGLPRAYPEWVGKMAFQAAGIAFAGAVGEVVGDMPGAGSGGGSRQDAGRAAAAGRTGAEGIPVAAAARCLQGEGCQKVVAVELLAAGAKQGELVAGAGRPEALRRSVPEPSSAWRLRAGRDPQRPERILRGLSLHHGSGLSRQRHWGQASWRMTYSLGLSLRAGSSELPNMFEPI